MNPSGEELLLFAEIATVSIPFNGAIGTDLTEVNGMGMKRWAIALISLVVATATCNGMASTDNTEAGAASVASAAPAIGIVLVAPPPGIDPCEIAEVTASPTRPNWDTSASTTQCGIIESDYGWMSQAMGAGVGQQLLVTSMRYGLTPKLDLRWGLTNHIAQSGGGRPALEGVGDQWLSARYRFLEQSRWVPAMAFDYGFKVPMANPAKGFGSGFADNQFILIVSRDFGKNHLDFNTVGTIVGQSNGRDGSAQFGLALTRPVTPKLSVVVESYGGPQPGTSDRFGAAFAGAAYNLRPTIVIDGAYSRTYTAGSPRQQIMFGMTFAIRPGFMPLPKTSAFARLLGR